MRRRSGATLTFSLSFLDVMSVGLGSVILIFLIIHHASEVRSRQATAEQLATLERARAEFDEREARAEALARRLEQREAALSAARNRLADARRVIERARAAAGGDAESRVPELRDEVRALEAQVAELKREIDRQRSEAVFRISGDGRRQYLTGLRMDGRHVLILLDTSASMLSPTIVEAIRLRNMSDKAQAEAGKWTRALDSVEWLVAQLDPAAQFQLYRFAEDAEPLVPARTGDWLDVDDGESVRTALARMRELRPRGGTSLQAAFSVVASMQPPPDSVFLVTDHTPTVGSSGGRGRVSPERRMRLLAQAYRLLPGGVPINVILLPMEGDPMAASQYWQLANVTGGVLLSPSWDWP